MAHGTRNRVWRVAVAGVGALLCGGLVGCMNTDKPKEKVTTKPGIGLPGTPTLPPTGATATKAPSGTPGAFAGAGANLQPQPRAGTTGANTNTSGVGSIQPAGGFSTQPGGISAPTPPAGTPGTVPPPSMPWPASGSNYPPGGPTNPVVPPMTDISPPAPFGAPGASVLPPQPAPGAPAGGFGVLPPTGPG